MRNLILLLILLKFFSISLFAQETVVFKWVKSMGGLYYDYGNSITVDNTGNVYVTGRFQGTVDFDPGPGTYNLSSIGDGSTDIFISKFDPIGNFLWAKQIGGIYEDNSYSIASDDSGNVFITGSFIHAADFDPGIGVYMLTTSGEWDAFILKLNPSGNFVWAKKFDGTGWCLSYNIAIDHSGFVYTTGLFSDTVDFDPSSNFANLIDNSDVDVFISKLDAQGNYVWAKQFRGEFVTAFDIAVDDSGNVYTSGQIQGTADLDPGTNTYICYSGAFVSKLNSMGNFVWAKSFTGNNNCYGKSIALDKSGNIYTTGYFAGNIDFDPGPGNFYLATGNNTDFFISKLNNSGNFVWAKQIGGNGNDESNCITTDRFGNIYITGYFNNTVDFDPNASQQELTSAGMQDVFVLKIDTDGNYKWAKSFGGNSNDIGNSICVDTMGNVYTTGIFQGTADFDPDSSSYSLISFGNSDIFVQKMHWCGAFQNEQICLVTVDTSYSKNKVTWEKTFSVGTINYNIYKEVATNVYQLIGTVPFDSSAIFIDISSVPDIHADKYKISTVDTCDNESNKSYFHKTMNLVISTYGTTTGLNWSPYEDESGVFIPAKYFIYRGLQVNNLQLYDSISGSFTSYNDNNVTTPYYYMIGTQRDDGCNSGQKSNFPSSFSNKKKNAVGIDNNQYSFTIKTYPTPFKNELNIEVEGMLGLANFEILNSIGQVLYKSNLKSKIRVLTENLSSGIYLLKIENGKSIQLKKIIKE